MMIPVACLMRVKNNHTVAYFHAVVDMGALAAKHKVSSDLQRDGSNDVKSPGALCWNWR